MSVLSVEPLALGGPGEIGAERAQRPGRGDAAIHLLALLVKATATIYKIRKSGWTPLVSSNPKLPQQL